MKEHLEFDLWKVFISTKELYAMWADRHGITTSELAVIYAMDRYDLHTQKDICRSEKLKKAIANSVIRGLKEKGYITMENGVDDRREKMICFTEAGEAYVRDILSPLYELEAWIYHMIGRERTQQMIETAELFNILFEKKLRELDEKRVDGHE